MEDKILIPLVGIHSAGKSTVRKYLEIKGFHTEEECAEILRIEKKLKAGANADLLFEKKVRYLETIRDIERQWNNGIVLVESWHILTLAYMLTRGIKEEGIQDYFKYVKEQEDSYSIYCIFLKSDPLKILERSQKLHTEDNIKQYYGFYKKLEINIKYVLDKLEFKYKEFNTMKEISETMKEITEYIKEIST